MHTRNAQAGVLIYSRRLRPFAGRELKSMTEPTGSEWPRELIVKAARMLSYCQRVQRQGVEHDPFIFIAGALIAFEDMSPEEALKLLNET